MERNPRDGERDSHLLSSACALQTELTGEAEEGGGMTMGKGAADALALAFGFPEEDGGRAVAVGDDIDLERNGSVASYMETNIQSKTPVKDPKTDLFQ